MKRAIVVLQHKITETKLDLQEVLKEINYNHDKSRRYIQLMLRKELQIEILEYEQAIQILELNSLYPVLEDAQRIVADSTHGEASNH